MGGAPGVGPGGECWAAKSWVTTECAKCAAPEGNACPPFSWTACAPTLHDCNLAGSNCKYICPINTLNIAGLTRPTFRGPSCYNNEYGSQFGPQWVPTGKTRFEHYIKNATHLHTITQTIPDDLPWLKNQAHPAWNLQGCDAATAVYENIVCAIEILTAMDKRFEALPSGDPGNKITDFANNGNEQADRRELAVFLSQSWKETARMQVWEETPGSPYADCTAHSYACGKDLHYHGRGPVQLSWNYNYGPFSEWFYGDKMVLLDTPDQLDPEGPMGIIAYFWFWFTPREFSSGFPITGNIRMRDPIIHWTDGKMNQMYRDGKDYDSVAGLGLATNVQNGGIECSPGVRCMGNIEVALCSYLKH